MPLNADEIVRVTVRFINVVSGDIENVYHFYAGGAVTDSDQDITDAIADYMETAYTGINTVMHGDNDPYDIKVDVVTYAGGRETVVRNIGQQGWTMATPPAGTGDLMPSMDACIVTFRTPRPKSRGRKFIGAITEAVNASGSFSGNPVTYLTNYAADILTNVGTLTSDLVPCVLSQYGTTPQFALAITEAIVNTVIGTQRRRRKGVGR